MDKPNVFKSSKFYMADGDILHMLFEDETGTTVVFTLNTEYVDGSNNEDEVPDAPLDITLGNATSSSFDIDWNYIENATGFYLDVATDSAFSSMVAGYNGLDVGFIDEYTVTGLIPNFTYYCRLRAYNDNGDGTNSDTETIDTLTETCSDWFLPSLDELQAIYDEIYLHDLITLGYQSDFWTSSEVNATNAYIIRFTTGDTISNSKFGGAGFNFFPCRSFISSHIYNLRDKGVADGYIFHIIDNGDGTYTYYELYPDGKYSAGGYGWIDAAWQAILIGSTDTIIGSGETNTSTIVTTSGDVTSVAKVCSDIVV